MTYTFSQRRGLNRKLKAAYPWILFDEDTTGVPRMRTTELPKGAHPVADLEELRAAAILHWQTHRTAIPVLITFRTERWEKTRPAEINYVSHRSHLSLEEADRYIAGGRLYLFPATTLNKSEYKRRCTTITERRSKE